MDFFTPAHGWEPRYPGAVERIVDLSRFADVTAAKAARRELMARTDEEAAARARAFHALKAARQIESGGEAAARHAMDWRRAERRIEGIIGRELRRRGTEAGVTVWRFLGSVTYLGEVCRFDTVEALCPRVYVLADSWGLGGGLLERLRQAACSRSWNTVACPAAEDPSRIEHLLAPGLGLAFVTSRPGMEYPGKPYRRVRLDALTRIEDRGRLRLEERMARLLRRDAVESLGQAGAAHGALEALCAPYVDFDGVRTLAAVESARWLSWM